MYANDEPTVGEIIEEVTGIVTGLGVMLLPVMIFAIPGLVLLLPLVLLALPLVLVAALLAPVYLVATRGRRARARAGV
jgi:hypothetical protein